VKKVLLIGSTGLIGKQLKSTLSKHFFLICPTKKDKFDITKKKELSKYLNESIDIVINLSGQRNNNQKKMIETIYKGNLNILDISKKIKKKILLIYVSSSLVYGNSKIKKKEISKKKPINKYEKIKYEIEKKYLKINKNFLILRLCNIYGSKSSKGIINLILQAIKNKKIFEIDNIKTFKNFIHIHDVVNIIHFLIIKNIKNKILNVGNENICFKDLIKIINKITKNSFKFTNKNKNINLTLSQKIDTSLIKKIMSKYKFQKIEKYLNNEIAN